MCVCVCVSRLQRSYLSFTELVHFFFQVDFSFDYNVENTMTVLHLAAALGFTKLIQLLLKWVEGNPNKLIMAEACPTQCDQFSLLPIMWSSAKGHFNTTCVLHQVRRHCYTIRVGRLHPYQNRNSLPLLRSATCFPDHFRRTLNDQIWLDLIGHGHALSGMV